MNTASPIKDYYEAYWSDGLDTFSGSNQGYANNFRKWMHTQLSGLPASAPILEVGCGDGSFTKDLAKYSSAVSAIDISAGQIAENARKYPQIAFRQHDVAEPLPFPDATFEVAWCSEVLEHLLDPGFAVKEIYRVLKPGGKFLATVPYHGRFKNVMIALFKWDEHFVPTNPHIRFYTEGTLSQMARKQGFTSIQLRTCGMGRPLRDLFIPTNILMRALKPAGEA